MDVATKPERVIQVFEVPERLIEKLGTDKFKSIGMVELTAAEEMAATKRSRQDPLRLAVELTKQAIVEVNGQRVSIANQSVDKAWEEFPSKIRSLALAAYNELHNPDEEEQKGFLESRATKIGK